MAATPASMLRDEVKRLADDCLQCFQCGQCTSGCPNARDLSEGPRRIVRLALSGDIDELMASADLWRCSECGACTRACPMEVDPAALIAALRDLEREHGAQRCPERSATAIATRRLKKHDRVDNLAFGMTMAAKGHLPRDVVGAAGAAAHLVGQSLGGRGKTKSPAAHLVGQSFSGRGTKTEGGGKTKSPAAARPFYPGCALPQDGSALKLTRAAAAALNVPLAEASDTACCGHPTRGAVPTSFASAAPVLTACPACDVSLREAGLATRPLWEELADSASRSDLTLAALSEHFVPYVGCLAERGLALEALATAASLARSASGASVTMDLAYPSLHAACCGALGGMYRGESDGARRLLDFAVERQAPIVTTCLLCRDNLRSAARRRHLAVTVHFWPEFFQAATPSPEEPLS